MKGKVAHLSKMMRVSWIKERPSNSDSRFLLRPTDGRARVWPQRNTSFQDNHILGTTSFGGGVVTVLGCFSFDCKLDLYVLDGNLTGQKYSDNVLDPCVVPHFDNRALTDTPMFMDDNARPHRARIVQHYFYSKRLFRQFHDLRCRQTWILYSMYGTLLVDKLTNAIQNVKIVTN